MKSFGDGGLGRELLWEFCGLKNVDDKILNLFLSKKSFVDVVAPLNGQKLATKINSN